MRPEIDAYIREHRGMYTIETLRRQLIEAGHDPVEVDAALRGEEAAGTGNRSGSGLKDTAWALYVIGAILGTGGALLLVGVGAAVAGGPSLPVYLAVFAVAYVGLGYLLARVVGWAASEFEIRGVVAFLIGLVLVPIYGALMLGTCIAAANLAGGG